MLTEVAVTWFRGEKSAAVYVSTKKTAYYRRWKILSLKFSSIRIRKSVYYWTEYNKYERYNYIADKLRLFSSVNETITIASVAVEPSRLTKRALVFAPALPGVIPMRSLCLRVPSYTVDTLTPPLRLGTKFDCDDNRLVDRRAFDLLSFRQDGWADKSNCPCKFAAYRSPCINVKSHTDIIHDMTIYVTARMSRVFVERRAWCR